MTPEDWKNVEDALSSPYGRVEFKIDGYDIGPQSIIWTQKGEKKKD